MASKVMLVPAVDHTSMWLIRLMRAGRIISMVDRPAFVPENENRRIGSM